jgi:hypothetical protein
MPAAPKIAGTIRSKNPLKGAVEVLPVRILRARDSCCVAIQSRVSHLLLFCLPLSPAILPLLSRQERLFFAALKTPPPSHNILASVPKRNADPNAPKPEKKDKKQIHFFNMDNELVYWNFFLDFGPLNLGQLVRFSQKLNDKLKKFPVVCFYSSTHPAKRTNAIYLMCAWQVLYLSRSPEEAYRGFDEFLQSTVPTGSRPPVSDSQGAVTIAELPPFHDASPIACTYDLTVMDCLKGIIKARQHGFFDLDSFNLEEYEYFEQVEVCVWLVDDGVTP